MKITKEHIVFKFLSILLIAFLLAPTATKLAHIFTHHDHEHEVCQGETKTHLHELDADCEFYKFQLNKTFSLTNFTVDIFSQLEITLKVVSQYQFINEYQRLQTSLRGPPTLV